MSSVPEVMRNRDVDPSGRYRCPSCVAQTTADREDMGWIACPMLDGQIICMGCCFDYEGTARSRDFDDHPALEDFVKLAERTGRDIGTLRLICLQHQERLYIGEIERASQAHVKQAMRDHLSKVREIIGPLGEEGEARGGGL